MAQKRATVQWVMPTPYAVTHIYVTQSNIFWLSRGSILLSSFLNGRIVGNGVIEDGIPKYTLRRLFPNLYPWVWLTSYREVWDRFGATVVSGRPGAGGYFTVLDVGLNTATNDFLNNGVALATGYPFLGLASSEAHDNPTAPRDFFATVRSPFIDPNPSEDYIWFGRWPPQP